jgi:predicted RNase H-like HicB family nuclease
LRSTLRLTALVWQEGDEFVSLCPEVDVASFGTTIDEALAMLREELGAYFAEAAVPDLPAHGEPLMTTINVELPGAAAGALDTPADRIAAIPVGTSAHP